MAPKKLKKFLADQQKKQPNWTSERFGQVARLLENPVK